MKMFICTVVEIVKNCKKCEYVVKIGILISVYFWEKCQG